MGRKPRAKKAENAAIAGILDALKFCEPASKEIGSPNQTHLKLANNWAIAFDGTIAIGAKINSDINAFPHTRTLIKALSKCDDATQITQLGNNTLSVKSGRFQTYVPCLAEDLLGPIAPDPACAHVTPAVFNALKIVGPIAQENAPRIMLASVMLRSGSAVATDGKIMMEAWHGIDLPPILVPKLFITIISKIEKPPIYFGFSPNSATFYFDDQSWIRTQLWREGWPDIDKILNTPANQWAIPDGLWEGLNKIADFADDHNRVYFADKSVRTRPATDEAGAICEIAGALPPNVILNIRDLLMIGDKATTADFQAGERREMAIFYGPNFRAMLSHIKVRDAMDDDIPL